VFRDCLWLVKNGVPYDVAFGMNDEMRVAHVIVLGEYEGNDWDYNAMRWKERQR